MIWAAMCLAPPTLQNLLIRQVRAIDPAHTPSSDDHGLANFYLLAQTNKRLEIGILIFLARHYHRIIAALVLRRIAGIFPSNSRLVQHWGLLTCAGTFAD